MTEQSSVVAPAADVPFDVRYAWIVVAICCTALFMTTLDSTILNVALPALQKSLRASAAGLQWAVDGFVLLRASSLFLSGSIGDRFGRKLAFNTGLIMFTAGSLTCALSPNVGALIAARCFQGLGSAVLTPASLAIVSTTFPDQRRRALAVGIWAGSTGISAGAGPIIGGALVEAFGWRSVFVVNLPIGIAALIAARILTESKAARPRPFDVPGQATLGFSLFFLTYGLISAPSTGWGDPTTLAMLIGSVALFIGFIMIEQRRRAPMLPLSVFSSPSLTGSLIIATVAFLVLGSFLFFNTLYLQDVRGFSPLEAGVLIVPTTAVALVLSPLSGHITGTRGPRLPASIAILFTACGLGLLAVSLSTTTPIALLLLAYLLLGIGLGLINPPTTNAAVSALSGEQAGVAGAIVSTGRQVGSNLGIALVGSIVFSITAHLDANASITGQSLRGALAGASFVTGLRWGDFVVGTLSLLSFVVAWRAFRPVPKLSAPVTTGQGFDAGEIPGIDLGGRITSESYFDAHSVISAPTVSAQPAMSAPPAPEPAPSSVPVPLPNVSLAPVAGLSVTPAPRGARDEVVSFSTIRQVTAVHMAKSATTAARALVSIEADFENVERVRRSYHERFRAEEGVTLTYLPFVAHAVVEVIRNYPELNASVGENALVLHQDVNLGFAIDLAHEGLIVPVVRNADAQSLRGIARSIADLTARARTRNLSVEEVTGGTFTITNPSPFGTIVTVPIIIQPQVAILATDAVKRKAVVVVTQDGTESIAIHSVGVLAMSFDHRAVDGAYAAAFLHDVASVIANRDWTAEL